jgi:hypothetical protein
MSTVIFVKFQKQYSNLYILDLSFEICNNQFAYFNKDSKVMCYDRIENFTEFVKSKQNLNLERLNRKYQQLNTVVVYDPNYEDVVDYKENIVLELQDKLNRL